MPTKKPRVQVSLTPETFDLVEQIAAAVGASRSSIIGELIEEAQPHLEKALMVLRQVKTKPGEALDHMANMLAQAQFQAGQAQLDLNETRRKLRKGSTPKGGQK